MSVTREKTLDEILRELGMREDLEQVEQALGTETREGQARVEEIVEIRRGAMPESQHAETRLSKIASLLKMAVEVFGEDSDVVEVILRRVVLDELTAQIEKCCGKEMAELLRLYIRKFCREK